MNLPNLMRPLRIGPTELPNRIVSTAHQTTLVHDHLPTDDFVAYHEARARGGVGMIVMEADGGRAARPAHRAHARRLPARDRRRLPRASPTAVQPHGTRLFVQLFHGGREQIAVRRRARRRLAPSAVPSHRFHVEPRALRDRRDRRDRRGLRRAAPALAAEAGSTASRSRPRTATSASSSSTPT